LRFMQVVRKQSGLMRDPRCNSRRGHDTTLGQGYILHKCQITQCEAPVTVGDSVAGEMLAAGVPQVVIRRAPALSAAATVHGCVGPTAFSWSARSGHQRNRLHSNADVQHRLRR
jgi:hypothetical protein